MERKMFGKRIKKSSSYQRPPGLPVEDMDESMGKSKDNPPGYEGKEHVKYKNPGYSKHNIRYPEDEPHMKSYASKEEMHEMEDNYHMGVPKQTKYSLEKKIPRARMRMDDPEFEEPDPIRGNMVHNTPYRGEVDTTGEEEEGPNYMQGSGDKEKRKKMIVAVARRKMKKK